MVRQLPDSFRSSSLLMRNICAGLPRSGTSTGVPGGVLGAAGVLVELPAGNSGEGRISQELPWINVTTSGMGVQKESDHSVS
jgi:hypothetical protein